MDEMNKKASLAALKHIGSTLKNRRLEKGKKKPESLAEEVAEEDCEDDDMMKKKAR
jgi:hypothetical protein